jgi:hypothetical protein
MRIPEGRMYSQAVRESLNSFLKSSRWRCLRAAAPVLGSSEMAGLVTATIHLLEFTGNKAEQVEEIIAPTCSCS